MTTLQISRNGQRAPARTHPREVIARSYSGRRSTKRPTTDQAGDAFLRERATWYRAQARAIVAVSWCWVLAFTVWGLAAGIATAIAVAIGLTVILGGAK